jgi:glycosyltransferase involved in cell wall biosynthesis
MIFILPNDKSMPSRYVRALYLNEFNTHDIELKYIDIPPIFECKGNIGKYIFKHLLVPFQSVRIKKAMKNHKIAIMIKPNSPLLILFLRILGVKIILDINDPIHLRLYSGRFGGLKFKAMMMISSFNIFESEEYLHYWGDKYIKKSVVIEDTPQHETKYNNYKERHNRIIWVGSPATSKILLGSQDCFASFYHFGVRDLLLLGADKEVASEISKTTNLRVENIISYNIELMTNELSSSRYAFCPSDDTPFYSLRGNLKAKIMMSHGCITFAKDLAMHKRLIENGYNGFLFETHEDISNAFRTYLDDQNEMIRIASNANILTIERYSPKNHLRQLINLYSFVSSSGG